MTLTSDDLACAEKAVQTLLAPLDYPDLNDWRRAVTRRLKAVAGAEVCAFMLPGTDAPFVFCEEAPGVTDEDYLQASALAFDEFDIVARLAQSEVSTMTSLLKEERSAFVNTSYVQDFLQPMRCFEPAMLTSPPDGFTPSTGAMPHIHLHKSRPQERFSEKEVALLRLLYPAFRTGVETAQRVEARQKEVLRLLDTLTEGALLVEVAGGDVLHTNRALTAMQTEDLQWPDVETAMMRLARGFSGSGTRVLGAPVQREVVTAKACYRLRATLLGEELMGRVPAVLVTAHRARRDPLPDEETLRRRFRLTPQQARVARLLAERRSNAEIAEALFISEHTVRHHVENVLLKLDLDSRLKVRAAILGKHDG